LYVSEILRAFSSRKPPTALKERSAIWARMVSFCFRVVRCFFDSDPAPSQKRKRIGKKN
jgi:hypothetical protein